MGGRTGKRIGITWHKPSGQFKKYIGKQIGRAGKPQPKCFYLGSDQRAAVERAVELTNEWNRLVRDGQRVWPSSASWESQRFENSPTMGIEINAAEATLEDAVKLYVAEQEARVDAGQVSDRHAQASRYRLKWMMNTLGPSRSLNRIGQQELTDLVHRIVKRPPSKKVNQRGEAVPISIATAVGLIKAAKMFFEWLADHDVIEWVKPKRFRQIFRIKRSNMLTEDELQARDREVVSGDVKRFAIDELGRLYIAADGRIPASGSTIRFLPSEHEPR